MQNIGINYVEYFLLALHIASHEIAPNMSFSADKYNKISPLTTKTWKVARRAKSKRTRQPPKWAGERPRVKSVRSPSQRALIVCGVPKAPNHRTILKWNDPFGQNKLARDSTLSHEGGCFWFYLTQLLGTGRAHYTSILWINAIDKEYSINLVCKHDFPDGFA